MQRKKYYEQLHKKNMPAFIELFKRITLGFMKIIDIRIDEPQFGHKRVVIFFHEED